ncbi:MAG: hypothetical protein ACTHOJ_07410 [Sphingomonas oligoaromativorans]
MLFLLAAQLAAPLAPPSAASSDQDRVTAAEVLAYAQWRNCVLKVTHHTSRRIKDHEAVADAAIAGCSAREADYRASLKELAQLYRLKDSDGFATRTSGQARKTLRDMALKELK